MWFWIDNIFKNLLPLLVVGLGGWEVARAGREPLWGEAYRRLRRNWLAVAAFAIIGIYGTVAFLDALGWRHDRNAPRVSVVDRLFASVPVERTYSAPLATMTTGEPKPQPLKGRHLLGTDGVG